MSVGPLAGLLLDEATADRPVAISGGHVIALRRFRADVAATAARLAAAGCRSGLVACDDAYWAAVGLFALAHGGSTAMLATIVAATRRRSPGSLSCPQRWRVQQAERIRPWHPANGGGAPRRRWTPTRRASRCSRRARPARPSASSRRATARDGSRDRRPRARADRTPERLGSRHGRAPASLRPDLPAVLAAGHRSRILGQYRSILGTPARRAGGGLGARLQSLAPIAARRSAAAAGRTLPSTVLSGGAPLPDSAVQATRDVLGCATREFFGSTEAGVVASRLRQGEGQPPWRPMPGLTVTRLGDGRLHVCSPYLGSPDNAVTGDLIELDGDGGFRLMGRADRIAKIEGLRISLGEFDARLAELAGVSQAAVVELGAARPISAASWCWTPPAGANLRAAARSGWDAACGATSPGLCRPRLCRAAGVSCWNCRAGRSARRASPILRPCSTSRRQRPFRGTACRPSHGRSTAGRLPSALVNPTPAAIDNVPDMS